MDDGNDPTSPHNPYARLRSDAAPIATEVRQRQPAGPLRESSLIVYCGNARQVSEGFAIALRTMGVEANFCLGA
jgi:hypothetical protein